MSTSIQRYWNILITFIVFLFAFLVVAWQLDKAPDIFTDEIIYTRIAARVSHEGALVWDNGSPFVVHPPVYFLIAGFYQSITGNPGTPAYSAGDIFTAVYHTRQLNAFFAALTAVLLYWIGRKLKGESLGWLLVILFVLDPFGIRINRRAMLETSAEFFSLTAVWIFLSTPNGKVFSWSRTFLVGLTLGIALLTKELTFPLILSFLLLGAWNFVEGRIRYSNKKNPGRSNLDIGQAPQLNLKNAIVIVLIALTTYSLYPLWAALSGNWSSITSEKFLSFRRLLGLVQITGWNRPGLSFSQILLQRLTDYGSTYLIFALGSLALLAILIFTWKTFAGRFLIAWGLIIYPFFAFLALFGAGNDQFFYFLLVPAIILVGYACNVVVPMVTQRIFGSSLWSTGIAWLPMAGILMVTLPFNTYRWINAYVIHQDDGYYRLSQYVSKEIPAGTTLNASGDPIKFQYFLPQIRIGEAATPAEAQVSGIHYFVLAPKDVLSQYGRIQPDLAEWITTQGTRLFIYHGDSYGDIFLYRVDYPSPQTALKNPPSEGFRSFSAAHSGFISTLEVFLLIWILIVVGAAIYLQGFDRRKSRHLLPLKVLDGKQPKNPNPKNISKEIETHRV